jgi:rod shape determining protein RodA
VGTKSSLDWALVIPALLLSLSGLVYVYSAAWIAQDPPGMFFGKMFLKQASFLAVSMVAFYLMRKINWGARPATFLMVLVPALLLLVLVLVIGHTSGTNAKSWISLGPVDMQPSEFAKLAMIMSLAWLYSDPSGLSRLHFVHALVVLLCLLGLVLAQPDLGTGLVFLFTFFVVGALAAVPRKYLVGVALLIALLAVPAWFQLKEYQRNRFYAWINPAASTSQWGYQTRQSEIAIGSGGLFGKGFLRGTQVQRGIVPVVESDFIFALVGEEFGFVGCTWVLLLFLLLLARIIAIARNANTEYEKLLCLGVSAVLLCHLLIAAGMTVRITPITGLPLPFVSYGGSAMLSMWIMLAICHSVWTNSAASIRPSRPVRSGT